MGWKVFGRQWEEQENGELIEVAGGLSFKRFY